MSSLDHGSAEFTFELKETPDRGRGLFASRFIAAHTLIHVSNPPLVAVICSPYRKETCARCYRYDNGRKLKFSYSHDVKSPSLGWFCSKECKEGWTEERTEDELRLRARVEANLAQFAKRQEREGDKVAQKSANGYWSIEQASDEAESRPWRPSDSLPLSTDPDLIRYFVEGIFARLRDPTRYERDFLPLAASPHAYASTETLHNDLAAARYLRSLLPSHPFSTVREIRERDTGNSFGIRDETNVELLGFATYALPTSGFNHSCSPNVDKTNEGLEWRFTTARDIEAGEELVISYLGSGEALAEMKRDERQTRAKEGWGFACHCTRCTEELAE